MYGFLEDYQTIIDCAKQLQDRIEAVCDESGIAIPQVSISLGQCAAIIEVDELQIWHSEVDSLDLTPEMVIESFTEQCGKWSRFSAGPSA
jgi:hypothetical protein